MPPDTAWSLSDLARLADVTPRTVRYYVSQGLLPSPGAGPYARYGEGHLQRLRLIRRLQREHLPLAEIRRRLEALSDDQVAALEAGPAPSPPADSAAQYIGRLLGSPTVVASEPPAAASPARMPSTQAPEPDRSTWERHALSPDVELHVRRPLERRTSKQIDRLIRIARELLADEP